MLKTPKILFLYFICLFLCSFCKNGLNQNSNSHINDTISFCLNKVSNIHVFESNFRDIEGEINWNWPESTYLGTVPDKFYDKYLTQTNELSKWKNYQQCYCEYFKIFQDTLYLMIIYNRVLNNNESNQYLIIFNNLMQVKSVFLLAKIEKSIDGIYEIRTSVMDSIVKQTQLYTFTEGNSVVYDSVIFEYRTSDFVKFNKIYEDSIRITN